MLMPAGHGPEVGTDRNWANAGCPRPARDGSWWSERLQEAGFLPPRASNHFIVIAYVHQPEHPLAKAAQDAKGWYLTDGDRDDETMG